MWQIEERSCAFKFILETHGKLGSTCEGKMWQSLIQGWKLKNQFISFLYYSSWSYVFFLIKKIVTVSTTKQSFYLSSNWSGAS